jgi:hypothetical protein
LTSAHQAWDPSQAFTTALAARVNVKSSVLAPPLYGRWLAKSSMLSTAANAAPPWFHQLNGDPRARVAAGLGTLVVQTEQQELLAGAWALVDGIRRINDRLRLSQLGRELSARLHLRHFSLTGDAFLQVTEPLHGRVRSGATTAAAQLRASPIVSGALGASWRRVARPLGSLGTRQGRPTAAPAQSALSRLNSGALAVLQPPAPPASTGAMSRLGDLGAAFKQAGIDPSGLHAVALPGLAVPAHPSTAGTATTSAPPPSAPPPPTGFAQAASTLMAQLGRPLAAGIQWKQADLGALQSALGDGLDPKRTIEAPLAGRLGGVRPGPKRIDPIEPVMAAPDFPHAMYEPLQRLSQSWIIPGLDQVPANTVALLATNWPFVESYLVGLNHEMARKLLWNGYPTDQRGTYFRHFWDLRSRADAHDTTGDIGPIHTWTGALGANRVLPYDPLVLLVRGELIRRYPNVVVYAAEGILQNGQRQPGPNEQQPLFFARLDPDVALFAFNLDPKAVTANPGWYFILQEHPSEPRFGLAAPTGAWGAQPATWQALGWDHLAANPAALAAIGYIDLNATLPKNAAAPDITGAVWHGDASRAADLAHITFRLPKRLAFHGSVLVPGAKS